MSKLRDLSGDVFGRLVVIARAGSNCNGRAIWQCQCACGKTAIVSGNQLLKGHTKSCGCYRQEVTGNARRLHGRSRSDVYRIWKLMRKRCTNPKDKNFARYGGRGIAVCEKWNRSFAEFAADMGPRPSPQHSLDRKDNDGNYEPSNCRWATQKEQTRNTVRSRRISVGGQTKTAIEWAEQIGMKPSTLLQRLRRGWNAEKAVNEAVA